MDPIEVDLYDDQGVIVSIASANPDVWVTLAAQANALAASKGYSIGTGPLYNSPERALASIGDVQNWLSDQNVGGASGRGSGPSAGVIAGILAAIGGAILLILGGRRA